VYTQPKARCRTGVTLSAVSIAIVLMCAFVLSQSVVATIEPVNSELSDILAVEEIDAVEPDDVSGDVEPIVGEMEEPTELSSSSEVQSEAVTQPEAVEVTAPDSVTFAQVLYITSLNTDAGGKQEYVGIYNPLEVRVQLDDSWVLHAKSESGAVTQLFRFSGQYIEPYQQIFIRNQAYGTGTDENSSAQSTLLFTSTSGAVYNSSRLTASGAVELLRGGSVVDSVSWSSSTLSSTAVLHDNGLPWTRCYRDNVLLKPSQGYGFYPATQPATPLLPLCPEDVAVEKDVPVLCRAQISEIGAYLEKSEQFIELYNPHTEAIELADCKLRTNRSDAAYTLEQYTLLSGEYLSITIDETPLTLSKTTAGSVSLMHLSSDEVMETVDYTAMRAGQSWVYSSDRDAWLATYTPTGGSANIIKLEPECLSGQTYRQSSGRCVRIETDEVTQAACPEGSYRFIETNRCRKIVSENSALSPCRDDQYRHMQTNRCRSLAGLSRQLTPCRDDQYRSEETNRCRSRVAANASLTPCRSDQYRHPETNRCRLISSGTAELTPCKEGQERNPDTNRCRKVQSAVLPAAQFAVDPIATSKKTVWTWWALGGGAAALLSYAGYEWRRELRQFAGRLRRPRDN